MAATKTVIKVTDTHSVASPDRAIAQTTWHVLNSSGQEMTRCSDFATAVSEAKRLSALAKAQGWPV